MNQNFSESNRREFLHRSALALAGMTLATALPSNLLAATGKKIPVGLQLYSVREQCKNDLPGVLAAVGKMGYQGVEFAGYHGKTAAELKKMLDDNGLVTCGTHTPYDTIKPSKLDETIEFNKTLGNKFLIVPWMKGSSKQDWLDKAKEFNEILSKVQSAGMMVGYHAHAHDFEKFGEQSAWDLFFGNTKPQVVMQLDTGNCLSGGADPVSVLKKYPGRAHTIHLKAHGAGAEAVIGEDKVDWKGVFDFCEKDGTTKWFIVEHESSKNPLDAVKRSLEAMKKMGKA